AFWKKRKGKPQNKLKPEGTAQAASLLRLTVPRQTPRVSAKLSQNLRIVQGDCPLITRFHVSNVAAACCTSYTTSIA
ncbi:MAG: hypothetical protein WA746_01965, partial [Isosphaeraceae bacterium]